MQATEILNNKLKREYRICVPATLVEEKAQAFVKEKGKNYKAPGFRPGKVPLTHLTQIFYPQALKDAMEEALRESSQEVLKAHNLRPALRPEFHLESAGDGKDLEYRMSFEVFPEVPEVTWEDLQITEHKVVIPDAQVEEELQKFASAQKTSKPLETPRPAQNGDTLLLDVGMALKALKEPEHVERIKIELGKGHFKPEIEESLVGLSPGDTFTKEMTVPPEVNDRKLAGKPFTMRLHIVEIRETIPCEVNEEFAKDLKFETIEALHEDCRKNLQEKGDDLSFLVLKRQILDYLSEKYTFDVPEKMVEMEFRSIWQQLLTEMNLSDSEIASNENQPAEAREKVFQEHAEKSEAELREEYQKIAQRRVRLGIVLSAVGTQHKVSLSQDEVMQAIYKKAMAHPGREKEIVQHYRDNEEAVLALQAPLFENKIIRHMVSHLSVAEKEISLKGLEEYFEKNMGIE